MRADAFFRRRSGARVSRVGATRSHTHRPIASAPRRYRVCVSERGRANFSPRVSLSLCVLVCVCTCVYERVCVVVFVSSAETVAQKKRINGKSPGPLVL